ncbi:hypothetical protein GCK32_006971 [Trichostrongylus colubriformis]|uniref:SXP/RAL-2 family protein Ani s 5-like cation-binding domain-containing protein n=1 Tax=Trichostrongylus colubriformis TaxID=6319 RepID=A0AAN8F324_TRICO
MSVAKDKSTTTKARYKKHVDHQAAHQSFAYCTVNRFSLFQRLRTHFLTTVMKLVIILLAFVAVAASAQRPVGPLHPKAPKIHYGPPPLPRELAYFVTTEARREYWGIISNRTLTIRQQNKRIKQWAEDNHISKQVKEIRKDRKKYRDALKKEVQDVIDFLPEAFKQFSAVLENKDLTPDEIDQRKAELMKLNPEVFRTLKFIFKQFIEGHGPYEFAE